MRFRCRRALLDIEDQTQLLSVSSVDTAELENLLDKAKSLSQELSDNSKATKEHAFSEAHDSDFRNNLVLVSETVSRVCRTLSTRIAYLQ